MSPDKLEGEVRGFRERQEKGRSRNPFAPSVIDEQVWTFRLERRQEGQHLPPIPVEMRGESFSGVINEGDIVRLETSAWHEGQIVRTNRLYNVTLNAPVISQAGDNTVMTVIMIIFLLAFLAFAYFVFSNMF